MKKQIIKITGMHCASCSMLIEKKLTKINGVLSVGVSYGNEKAVIEYNEESITLEQINKTIIDLGYGIVSEKETQPNIESKTTDKPQNLDLLNQKNMVAFIVPIMIISVIGMIWELIEQYRYFIPNQTIGNALEGIIDAIPVLPMPMHLLMLFNFMVATIFMFWVGRDYLFAIPRFITKRVATMDTLVGIGTFTAYLYSAVIFLFPQVTSLFGIEKIYYFDATIIVISFIFIGKYLEAKAKLKTNEAIELLIGLQTKSAVIEIDGLETEIAINDLHVDDIMIIKPGVKIPTDGEIVFGASSIDESLITGESLPVDKNVGDKVIGGTLNTQGFIKVRALKIGADTLLAQIIKTVDEAQSSKAPIQKLADRVSAVFVPIVIILALLTLTTWLVYGYINGDVAGYLPVALTTFVAVLVIACPCALGLATPLGIIVGTGLAGRRGILIKNAESLEKLYAVKTIVFDKTGTITKGIPEITDVETISGTKANLLGILKSLESHSEHPLAKSIIDYCTGIDLQPVTDFNNLDGLGVEGVVSGTKYYAGNLTMLAKISKQQHDDLIKTIIPLTNQGKTPVILFNEQTVIGFVTLADQLKDNAKDTISELHKLNIATVMLTGDHKNVALHIGKEVGISDVIAEVQPNDKADVIKRLKQQNGKIAMIGDGINDAPALALADVSVAMSTGSDIAIESADITILHGDLAKILKAIKISRLTMRKIKQNLFWAFAYNIVLIPLACGVLYLSTGLLLNPVLAGLAMAMSSISVVSNTLLMRVYKI